MTVLSVIDGVAKRLSSADLSFGHGTDNAWDEAVALVLGVTGLPDDQRSLEELVADEQLAAISEIARRRVDERIPLPYLLGRCTYAGLEFEVEPGVMIPRSPIGHLLPEGLRPWLHDPRRILDLCAGSGCLGIVAALAYPQSSVTLVELDATALAVAERNVARHGLGARVTLVRGDARTLELDARFDLVIANPPYVDPDALADMPDEFRAEPELGLAGGSDGLELVDAILQRLPGLLGAEGVFVCEVGASRPAFEARYPRLRVVWLDLPQGGEGVFVLEAAGLTAHTAP